ncbi:MAG: hypothetical protein OEO82_09250 [Gammaproteobacteria bacterium]|nr:hypothetical protein [Gammaproteobacteria bacterium]
MAQIPYATIAVSGTDALSFLQGQLTADLSGLEGDKRLRAAWCNPKGRVICILTVAVAGDGYTLTLPAELADAVLQRLTLFRFRAKVEFELRPATADELAITVPVADWLSDRLRAGIVEIWSGQSEQFTPHMLNLDLLGAISFDKGCYTGQEVVARTHYRGATKRRTLRFEAGGPVQPGAKVYAGDRPVGEVVNAIGTDLLAVVPIDKADAGLTVNGVSLRNAPLPYSLERSAERD